MNFFARARRAFQCPDRLGKVFVFYGGETTEREVSIESGENVCASLRRSGVEVVAVRIDSWKHLLHLAESFDGSVVLNLIHGSGGEDGKAHAVFELLNIPYVGSDCCACALSMDKLQSKRILQSQQIKTPDFALSIHQPEGRLYIEGVIPDFPVIVKPIREGSSNGITKVYNSEDLKQALDLAHIFDTHAMIERFIEGREITVPIIEGQALTPIEILPVRGIYDYHAKYIANDTEFFCPPKTKIKNDINAIAEQVFLLFNARHWGRVDFMVDTEDNLWVLEMNTIPGMTSHSLVPKSAEQGGLTFDQLVCGLVSLALPDSVLS